MAEAPTINCTGCGKQYKWKPEIAGRKVKCKCGTVMSAPAAPPAALEEPEVDLYALADDIVASVKDTASAAVAPVAPAMVRAAQNPPIGAVPRAAASASAVPSPMLGYQTRPTQHQVERGSPLGIEGDMGKDLILPIAMIVLGTGLNFFTLCGIGSASFAQAALWIGVSTILSTLLIAMGCFAAMRLLDFSLGSPLQALLKVAAIAIAPDAVGDLITATVPFGGMFATFLTLGIYFALLMVFFDLDGTEVMITTCIFWVIQTWIVMIIVMGILSNSPIGNAIRNSGGGNALIAAGGGGIAAMDIEDSEREPTEGERRQAADDHAIYVISGAETAERWFDSNPDATFHTSTRSASMQLTRQLYATGCTQVAAGGLYYTWDRTAPKEAHAVAITLPEDPDGRARALQLIDAFVAAHQATTERSDGHKFVVLEFSRTRSDPNTAGTDDSETDLDEE